MKKKFIAILLVTFVFVGLVSACASDNWATEAPPATADRAVMSLASPAFAMPEEEMEVWVDGIGFYGSFDDSLDINLDDLETLTPEMPVLPNAPIPPDYPETPESPQTGAGDGFAERIIYSASADIETLDFDATIEAVYKMLAANGGFIESSNVGGRSHWQIQQGHPSYRNAFFILRVPQERLGSMTGDLDRLGNVLSVSNHAENITAQFVDTEARLSALELQEERLLVMLSNADEIADMIVIEQSLADVRYRIESITSTLRNWENRIRFSSLTLFIQEVHVYTELEPEDVSYWRQIWNGLMNTFSSIGRFFMNLFMWFIVNLPTLILLAIFATVLTIVIRRIIRKRGNKVKEELIPIKDKVDENSENE